MNNETAWNLARGWAKDNLFSNAWNTTLTIVTALFVAFAMLSLLRFVFISADWAVVQENRRLLFLGRYPTDQEWRLWPPLWLIAALAGLSQGFWLRLGWPGLLRIVVLLAFLFTVLAEGRNALLLAIAVAIAVAVAGYFLALYPLREGTPGTYARRAVVAGWALALPIALLVLASGTDGVRTTLWGGFMLNVMLASVGIPGGFALGVVLALGRARSYPVISWTCTVYIEIIRAGPLIAWLFVARFVLPEFLPPVAGLDELDIVARAMIVLAGFTAAYVAEVVRGGLQSLPRGQLEAAQALGLNALQTTWLIVLPQALRAVIPSLVSQLISLWKDTTLVFALGLTDLLGAGDAAIVQREFIGRQAEVLLFVAMMFWLVAFSMSRLSMRIERTLGIGVR